MTAAAGATSSCPLSSEECRKATKYAIRVYNELAAYSKLDTCGIEDFTSPSTSPIPLLEKEEVVLGDLLGSGGFNHVYEVHALEFKEDGPHRSKTSSLVQDQARKALWKKFKQQGGDASSPLAVKFLNGHAMSRAEEYCNGAADLLLEARYLKILASYPHPHLIRLHGMSAAGPQGFSTGVEGGYFLILDRLCDTLDRRLEVWKELGRRKQQSIEPDAKLHLKAMLLMQLQVGQDLSSALMHLHKLRIIFRDLKPDNVGFDYKGVLKLFDFGLAKELDPRQMRSDRTYSMSGATGSRRYMAPEVAQSHSYHLSADVYSFGILLWEVLSLEKAFWDMSMEQHRKEVILAGAVRPRVPLPSVFVPWPNGVVKLIRECWDAELTKRPIMKDVYRILQKEMGLYARETGLLLPSEMISSKNALGRDIGSSSNGKTGRRESL